MLNAVLTAAEALASLMSSAAGFGSGIVSTLPAIPRRRQHEDRQHDEAGKPDAPAIAFIEHLPDRRRQQRAERARGRDHAQHGGAHRLRHRARRDRHRDRRRRAGERDADQHAAADQHAEEAVRARHQREAGDVEQRADQHDRPEAVAHGHGAGERLQETPGEVLHGERQREVGDGDADVVRQRLHEDAEALPQAHAQRQHDGGADQDRKRGTQDFQQGHVFLFSRADGRNSASTVAACRLASSLGLHRPV